MREEKPFTNIRSLLGALARAMNLLNPELEHHHEQTAYFAFCIAREMGIDTESIHRIIYAALLHDVGGIVLETPATVAEIESNAYKFAKVGAEMIRNLPDFADIAVIISYCQSSWSSLKNASVDEEEQGYIRYASIIHLADVVSTCLQKNKRVLNQVDFICSVAEKGKGHVFNPEVVDAFLKLRNIEFIWLDAMYNPYFLMLFTGEIHQVTLEKTVELTKLMSRIIDYRSAFTAMHSAGVSASAGALARLSGMSEEDCLKMEIAGNLHDVGKLVVPNAILEKPGKLTAEEFNVIKEHPYYTRLILMHVDNFENIADWAGFHHEKLNGRGYPFHFNGERLDQGSRILAVADIFSAITEERPYRSGMSREKTVAILNENVKNGAIDGDIVALLVDNYNAVNEKREAMSQEEGQRYFKSLQSVRDR